MCQVGRVVSTVPVLGWIELNGVLVPVTYKKEVSVTSVSPYN